MKALFTFIAVFTVLAANAQNKNPFYSGFNNITPAQTIFSFHMTTDTSLLKPIDTTYSEQNNVAFQAIRFRYKLDKKLMQLIIKNYNDGTFWRFRSIETEEYPVENNYACFGISGTTITRPGIIMSGPGTVTPLPLQLLPIQGNGVYPNPIKIIKKKK